MSRAARARRGGIAPFARRFGPSRAWSFTSQVIPGEFWDALQHRGPADPRAPLPAGEMD
jgi:hypothetical protein